MRTPWDQDRHINTDSNNVIIARKSDGNPEGKGRNGLLLDWYRSTPSGVVAKPPRQVLAELFTSMLVLSASFKFRPAVGARNGGTGKSDFEYGAGMVRDAA